MKNNKKESQLNIGIVSNEFFDKRLGRLGGYGWAAQRAASVFKNHPKCNARVCFLTAEKKIGNGSTKEIELNGSPVKILNRNRIMNMIKLLHMRIDILLTIDYLSTYKGVFNALPFTPIVTWVRDPRPPKAVKKMMSLRIPGKENILPAGIHVNNSQELAKFNERAYPMAKSVILANKMPHLKQVNTIVYHLPESKFVIPNPSVVDYSAVKVKKSKNPSVIFLARLDPIKRPWLFIELAKKFPDYDFYMLGKNHFQGENGWNIVKIPENLEFMGHVTGEEKYKILSSAWVLVNTSIHEESPVSVMEAFAFETPVISYEDWGNLVKDHGIVIGQHLGTGMDGLPKLANALEKLLSDDSLRRKYGKAARSYVETEHNDEAFLAAFRDICLASGVKKASSAITV